MFKIGDRVTRKREGIFNEFDGHAGIVFKVIYVVGTVKSSFIRISGFINPNLDGVYEYHCGNFNLDEIETITSIDLDKLTKWTINCP